MAIDAKTLGRRHPSLVAAIVVLKSLRTRIGVAIVAISLADALYLREVPFRLDRPNRWVWAGFALILAGLLFRALASGCIRKHQTLATTGVYALCRHPLYLGSMLMTYGFCCLLDDVANWFIATSYFIVFYTITILWEETRLAERYGEIHAAYASQTPLLLPFGRYRRSGFRWSLFVQNGGLGLMAVTVMLLGSVEVMALIMRSR